MITMIDNDDCILMTDNCMLRWWFRYWWLRPVMTNDGCDWRQLIMLIDDRWLMIDNDDCSCYWWLIIDDRWLSFDGCITLVSVAHPPTHNLDTGPPSDGGPPSTFGWGGVRTQINASRWMLCSMRCPLWRHHLSVELRQHILFAKLFNFHVWPYWSLWYVVWHIQW